MIRRLVSQAECSECEHRQRQPSNWCSLIAYTIVGTASRSVLARAAGEDGERDANLRNAALLRLDPGVAVA